MLQKRITASKSTQLADSPTPVSFPNMNRGTSHIFLLVLPDALTAQIAAFRLRLLGYDLQLKESAEDADTFLTSNTPRMLIVDPELPGMSGLELIRRIRREPDTKDTPVLICSDDSSRDAVRKAFLAGADGYLLTPFDPAVLESKVESLLRSRSLAAV